MADNHVHTEFSDDSREPMEEQVKKAVYLRFKEGGGNPEAVQR